MRAKGLPGLQMGAVAPVLISDYICIVNFVMFFRLCVLRFFCRVILLLNLLLQLLSYRNFLLCFLTIKKAKNDDAT